MKFLHTMIRVKNIQESLKFYENLLGLKVQDKKILEDCELYFLAEKAGDPEIELTYNFETPKEGYSVGDGFGHFAFAVDNMDNFTLKLETLGYSYFYKPYELELKDSNGNIKVKKIAFVKDYDGNEIEIIQK